MESKIEATRRLQREDRWAEAAAYKDSLITELRDNGMKRSEAQVEGWQRMIKKYPPLEHVEGNANTPVEPSADPQIEALLDDVDRDVQPDFIRDVAWSFQNLDRSVINASDVPSASALSLLKWARDNRSRFFEVLLPRFAVNFDSNVDQEVERTERKSIEAIQQTLGRFYDAGKPAGLDEQVSELVANWCERNRKQLDQGAQDDLEAEIAKLVAKRLSSATNAA